MAIRTITQQDVKAVYKQRPAEVKKYDYGLMLVVGGSEFYSGAPALSALAGWRAGVDMVYVIAPKRAADIIASFTPILAAYPVDGDYLGSQHLSLLLARALAAKEVARENASVVIGGGLGRTEETLQMVSQFLEQVEIPVVVDADAIHAVAKNKQSIMDKPFVLTPNTFEFALLTGREVRELPHEKRIEVVREEAKKLHTTIVLKAKTDIISNGEGVLLVEAGSPYLSIGGTGDTLAGIIGALLARKVDIMAAAAVGAYINSAAGELAGRKRKDSMIATDVIEEITNVIA